MIRAIVIYIWMSTFIVIISGFASTGSFLGGVVETVVETAADGYLMRESYQHQEDLYKALHRFLKQENL